LSRAFGLRRHVALAGALVGLLAAGHLAPPAGWLPCLLAASLALATADRALIQAGVAGRPRPASELAWVACLVALGALAGLGAGGSRLAAIDGGALAGPAGERVRVTGWVAGVPRRSFGEVRVLLDTPAGRLVAIAPEPVGELEVGRRVGAEGSLEPPDDPFLRSELERVGAALALRTDEIVPLTGARSGVTGALDRVRSRAEAALGAGMDDGEEALARGFVLGQDDLIDAGVRDEFKRSGLSHLLAVSGQNVMLLAILGGVLFGLLGAGTRMRLVLTLLLVAAYVPVAGGGPSIARAGVMGAAGIIATLAGRPTDRVYVTLLAAVVTLLINPRFAADPGWQLSFAALVGIMIWAHSLREVLLQPLARRLPRRVAAPLAEGIALTLAATVATAPLIAHDFERVSIAALPANLAVLPVIAPVMWLGMLIGLIAQLPAISIAGIDPVVVLDAVEGRLIGFVATVARVFSRPGWAQVDLPLPATAAVLAVYACLAAAMSVAIAGARRRAGTAPPRALALAASCVALLALAPSLLGRNGSASRPAAGVLRITALDVGQGDSILIQPPRGSPILVDGGPPGTAAADALAVLGIDRLRAVFVTHDELDHAGGVPQVLERFPAGELVHARPAPEAEAVARGTGARVVRTAEGGTFEFGRLELDVLWPPRDHLQRPVENRNFDAIVLAARFDGYDALLTADAEQEVTHLDPGPIDVLKVAHHGSDDAGLEDLIARSAPQVALISVGAANSYGHPTPGTMATLAAHGVCVLRTDLDGPVSVDLGPAGVAAVTASGPLPTERPGCAPDPG
jgi:competence protein ComEC